MDNVDRLIEELKPLADKLGEGAERVYALAVRQAYIEGVRSIFLTLALLGLAFGGVRLCLWCRRGYIAANENREAYSSAGDGFMFGGVAVALVSATCVALALMFAATAFDALANPQFYALRKLFQAVRG